MTGSIYLLDGDGRLEPMSEQSYDSESLLQELLAKYPDLLAGEQMNPDSPRRWLLIRREAGIPDADGAGNRWAVDHLFLDQDAVPTLVEVKRGGNEESFFVRHAYFLGANDPYKALKTTLKAEIDKEAWKTLNSDTSRPFPKPSSGRIAVKVINHLGDEVMKVYRVD
jgi:hypothetical protein